MNLFDVGDLYFDRIVHSQPHRLVENERSAINDSKVKVLLLDQHTTPIISMVATQTDLLQNEVYLVEKIENKDRDVMRQLTCLVYVKPTEETIDCLAYELANPKYGEYHIFFNNIVHKSQLEKLAEADSLEIVVKVEEIFQDYQIINDQLFSLDLNNKRLFELSQDTLIWKQDYLIETNKNLLSLFLSLKLKPDIIRYESKSKICLKLAESLEKEVNGNLKSLFDFPNDSSLPTQLVILDRNDDPITPLLQPWTYQSMIHDYIGIKRNLVDLSYIPNIDDNLKMVTLSPKQDAFFKETMYLNFGELGDKIKQYVTTYKDKAQISNKIDSLDDIKEFIAKYPEFNKLSGNVAKHMALVGELDKKLQDLDIWELSEVEQNLTVHNDSTEDYNNVLKLLRDPNLLNHYKLKLACIYSLRFDEIHDTTQTNNTKFIEKITELIDALKISLPIEDINYLHKFRSFFQKRKQQSHNSQTTIEKKDDLLTELAKKFNTKMDIRNKINIGGNDMTDNVYMQHIPKLSTILSDLSQNKLDEDKFAIYKKSSSNIPPPQDVIIFIVGGVTLEESRFVYQFNEAMANDRMRIILGGTSVITSKDYLNSLR